MKIAQKLFLLLAAAAVLPLSLTGGFLIWRSRQNERRLLAQVSHTFDQTSSRGRKALYSEARRSHQRLVEDKAAALQHTLEEIRQTVQIEATMARQALANPPSGELPPLYEADDIPGMMGIGSDFEKNIYSKKPYAVFHFAPGVKSDPAAPSLARLRGLTNLFAHNYVALAWLSSAYVGHSDGFIVGYPGGTKYASDFDPRQRDWYRQASEAKRTIWTKMYLDKDGKHAVITYASPVYEADGRLAAVAAVDIDMIEVMKDLFTLNGIPIADAVIIDDKGRVRATGMGRGLEGLGLDGAPAVKTPSVRDFRGGELVPVFQAIGSARGKRSGLVSPAGDDPTDDAVDRTKGLFAYARVLVGAADEHPIDWYYVVKTPIEPILSPVDRIARSFRALEDELDASLDRQTRRQLIEIACLVQAAVVLAALLAFFGARAMSRPLQRIAAAVHGVAQGDFEPNLPVVSKDEIGEVADAINHMAKELKEGHFIKTTFKRYVPERVVDLLLKDPELVKLGGERREMTVFFSDIAGFTALAESLSPEALVELINEYLGAMTLCIFSNEGTVDKYEGDAIMAFWGAPAPQPDHALRACAAALDNLKALEVLRGKWRRRGLPDLDIRIGINSGPMVVGNMGSMIKMDYTALGDHVNLGSRLEGANKLYGTRVLVSEHTWKAAKDSFEAREVDLLAVKGKTSAVKVYELLGRSGETPKERLAGYRAFEEGLGAYRARDWDKARALFEKANAVLGGDQVSKVFLSRVAEFRAAPPAKDWDGAFSPAAK